MNKEVREQAIENREIMLHEIHKAHESYYSVEHSSSGVSFLEYLAMHLVGAGYRLIKPESLTVIDDEEIAQAIDSIPEYNCFEYFARRRKRVIAQAQLAHTIKELNKNT